MTKRKPTVKIGDEEIVIGEPIPMHLTRVLVEMYYDFQKTRVESSNRALMNSERNGISKDDLKKYGVDSIYTKAKSFEEDIKKLLEKDLQYKPLYTEYLKFVTGMGAVLTAGAMAYIGDIKRFPKISSLWQYCGYGANTICEECSTDKKKFWTYVEVEYTNQEGGKKKVKRLKSMQKCNECGHPTKPERQTAVAGYQSNWNTKIKTHFYKCAKQFVRYSENTKANSRYRNLYDEYKLEERRKNPEKIKVDNKTKYNDGHIDNRTLRKIAKLLLSHIWLIWRIQEKLPVTKPYGAKEENHNVIWPFIDKESDDFDKLLSQLKKELE